MFRSCKISTDKCVVWSRGPPAIAELFVIFFVAPFISQERLKLQLSNVVHIEKSPTNGTINYPKLGVAWLT